MNPTQKQFSLNRAASKNNSLFPISLLVLGLVFLPSCETPPSEPYVSSVITGPDGKVQSFGVARPTGESAATQSPGLWVEVDGPILVVDLASGKTAQLFVGMPKGAVRAFAKGIPIIQKSEDEWKVGDMWVRFEQDRLKWINLAPRD